MRLKSVVEIKIMKTSKPINARFMEWINDGWVKIALKPGQRLHYKSGGRDEEGYSYTATTWEHCGDRVVCRSNCSARDCDGRLDRNWEGSCAIDRLASFENHYGDMMPDWEQGNLRQRDYAAEAMGY